MMTAVTWKVSEPDADLVIRVLTALMESDRPLWEGIIYRAGVESELGRDMVGADVRRITAYMGTVVKAGA